MRTTVSPAVDNEDPMAAALRRKLNRAIAVRDTARRSLEMREREVSAAIIELVGYVDENNTN